MFQKNTLSTSNQKNNGIKFLSIQYESFFLLRSKNTKKIDFISFFNFHKLDQQQKDIFIKEETLQQQISEKLMRQYISLPITSKNKLIHTCNQELLGKQPLFYQKNCKQNLKKYPLNDAQIYNFYMRRYQKKYCQYIQEDSSRRKIKKRLPPISSKSLTKKNTQSQLRNDRILSSVSQTLTTRMKILNSSRERNDVAYLKLLDSHISCQNQRQSQLIKLEQSAQKQELKQKHDKQRTRSIQEIITYRIKQKHELFKLSQLKQ